MIRLTEIHSLTDFLWNHKRHMAQIASTGRPELLTVNGRPRLVVQDAGSYEGLLRQAERLKRLEDRLWGLAQGCADRPLDLRRLLPHIDRPEQGGSGEQRASPF